MESFWSAGLQHLVFSFFFFFFAMQHMVSYRLPRWLSGKESACQCRAQVLSLGQEDPLEKEMAIH